MTALSVIAPTGTTVPAPRAGAGQIPVPRRPVDRAAPAAPGPRHGRHRVAPVHARTARTTRPSDLVTMAARAGSIVTLAAMLVAAAAAAGLTDGVTPTGPAAEVASTTLR